MDGQSKRGKYQRGIETRLKTSAAQKAAWKKRKAASKGRTPEQLLRDSLGKKTMWYGEIV